MKSTFVRYYDSWYTKYCDPIRETSWREVVKYRGDDQVWLVGEGGGRSNPTKTTVILETVTLEYDPNDTNPFEQLDWTNTYLNDSSQESGWLSPRGIFYGCPYGGHISSARLLLKTTGQDLEQRGYVKIHSKNNFVCMKEMTEEQAKWLLEHEYME